MKWKHLGGVALFAASVLGGSEANAATISIRYDCGGGAVTPVSGAGPGPVTTTFSCGVFTVNSVTATAQPVLPAPDLLGSTAFDISSGGAGVLTIEVTAQDVTGPAPTNLYLSTFTGNNLLLTASTTEATFLDAGNVAFATTTPLGTATFNAGSLVGAEADTAVASVSGLYSLTQIYTLTTIGAATTLSTINISAHAVPEPASMLLLGTGLLGLGGAARRRLRRQQA